MASDLDLGATDICPVGQGLEAVHKENYELLYGGRTVDLLESNWVGGHVASSHQGFGVSQYVTEIWQFSLLPSNLFLKNCFIFKKGLATLHLQKAIAALNSFQTPTTASVPPGNRQAAAVDDRKAKVTRLVNFLERVNLSLADIDKLSIIHVAGTKGKGSTCAFAESILRHHGFKTGFYSSPHLLEARERIRINGRPISKELFSSCFWDVYNKLLNTKDQNEGTMPLYFPFMTVMAFTLFVREKVDAVVLEVGIGGEYDCTNFVRRPVACGVASLGLDHTALLGKTLEEIAWHKAGIFKKGVPAVTVPQPDTALEVILQRSREIQSPIYIAEPLTEEDLKTHNLTLGIAGEKQMLNAALAVQLCRLWLRHREGIAAESSQESVDTVTHIPRLRTGELTEKIITGLSQCYWPGRDQTLKKTGVTYYLDGAHTKESIEQCVRWFRRAGDEEANQKSGRVSRSLVFNMSGDRPATILLPYLLHCDFDRAAFCPNIPSSAKDPVIPDQINFKVSKTEMLDKSATYRKVWDDLRAGHPKDADMTACGNPADVGHSVLGVRHMGSDTSMSVDTAQNHELSDPAGHPHCVSAHFPCISTALKWATRGREPLCRDVTRPSQAAPEEGEVDHVQVLVTGSLILVGDVLGIIYPDIND